MKTMTTNWATALEEIADKFPNTSAGVLRSSAAHIRELHQTIDSICAACDGKEHKGLPMITRHALEKFRHLHPCNENIPEEKLRGKIYTMLANSSEVKLKKKFRITQILNHKMDSARYFKSPGGIIVIAGNVIVTIHNGAAQRWEAMRASK